MTAVNEVGIKVVLKKDFPVIRETLERMGIINKKTKTIYPSCYCLETEEEHEKQKVFTIVHFKECFLLHDMPSNFEEIDKARLRTITYFLDRWGLVEVLDASEVSEILHKKIGVIPKNQKDQYKIVHKFKHR